MKSHEPSELRYTSSGENGNSIKYMTYILEKQLGKRQANNRIGEFHYDERQAFPVCGGSLLTRYHHTVVI